MRPVPSAPFVGPFADRLLALDFPSLPGDRRAAAVAFTIRRVDALPSVMRFVVTVIVLAFHGLRRLPASDSPLRVVLKWRVSTPACFEGGTGIYINTIDPWTVASRMRARLAELQAEGHLGDVRVQPAP